MYKKIILLIVFLSYSFFAIGQIYSGKVVTYKNKPVEYANVLLLSTDSLILTGAATDSLGYYRIIKNTIRKTSYIKIISLSYNDTIIPIANIKQQEAIIRLTESFEELQEVLIKGKQQTFSMKNGTLIANVTRNKVLKNSGSIDKLLNKIPFVYGQDGEFVVLGTDGSAEIYLNNHKVQDPGILQTLRSQDILSVEVIKNPGAKYGAEVSSVIMIKTIKKSDTKAISINQYIQVQKRTSTYSGVNLSMDSGKIYWNLSLGYSNTNMFSGNRNELSMTNSSNNSRTSNDVNIGYNSNYYIGKFSVNISLSKDSDIGLYSNLNGGEMKNEINSAGLINYTNGIESFNSPMSALSNNKPLKSISTLYFTDKVGNTNIDITDNLLYGRRKQYFDYKEIKNETNVNTNGKQHFFVNALLCSFNTSVKIFNIGYGFEITSSINKNNFSETEKSINTGIEDSYIKNEQTLLAGYWDLRFSFKSFSFYAGLRYEHEIPKYIENGVKNDKKNSSRNIYSPSTIISYNGESIKANIGYRRTVLRPSYSLLNNFIVYENRYAYQQGNPLLKNRISDLFSFMGIYKNFKWNFSYNIFKDKAASMLMPYSSNTTIVLKKINNVPKYSVSSLGLNWGTFYGNYYPSIEVTFAKQWLDYNSKDYNKASFNISLDNYVEFKNNWYLDIVSKYSTRKYNLFTRISHQWGYNITLSKEYKDFIFDLSFNNLFLDRKLKINKKMNQITLREIYLQDFSGVSLNISLRINSIKVKHRNKKSSNEIKRF